MFIIPFLKLCKFVQSCITGWFVSSWLPFYIFIPLIGLFCRSLQKIVMSHNLWLAVLHIWPFLKSLFRVAGSLFTFHSNQVVVWFTSGNGKCNINFWCNFQRGLITVFKDILRIILSIFYNLEIQNMRKNTVL